MLNEIPLFDNLTGITHQPGTIYFLTNREVEDDQYHQSYVFTLYPRSSIRRLLDNLTQSLIQKTEDNMARLKSASNHKSKYINEIFLRFHEINRSFCMKFCAYTNKIT